MSLKGVRLLSLGVTPEIIKETNLSEKEDEHLHHLLKIAMSNRLGNPLIISAPWQLQLLMGDTNVISRLKDEKDNLHANIGHYAAWSGNIKALQILKKEYPQLLTTEDTSGRSIAYYAAWSGRKEVLQWIKENFPELFARKNNYNTTIAHYAGLADCNETLQWIKENYPLLIKISSNNKCTIAHYAAWASHTEALHWIKKNQPDLLTKKDNHGRTIAHYAALSGHQEILQWIKDNYPKLLTGLTHFKTNIAHYAAKSGHQEALLWIENNYPELLTATTDEEKNIVFYAAESGNPEQLNRALNLSKTPQKIKFPYADTVMMQTLSKALDTNFTLTSINLPQYPLDIFKKGLRNKEIEQATKEFKYLLLSHYQDSSTTKLFNENILLEIFTQCLPADLPRSIVQRVFNKIIKNLEPHAINNLIIKKSFIALVENEQAELERINEGQKTIKLLSMLKKQINEDKSGNELKTILISFYQDHKKMIHHLKKNSFPIFHTAPNFSTREIFNRLFQQADIKIMEKTVDCGAGHHQAL